jgi:uncharacterized membrane protein
MWYWHDGPGGWGVLWMGVMMVVFWLPVIAILAWALRQFVQPPRDHGAPPPAPPAELDAREIARRTYARGEIDRERYLQIIEDLEHTGR